MLLILLNVLLNANMNRLSIKKTNHWLVAQTKPNGSTLAKINLERQGYQTFLPLLSTTVRKRKRFVAELKPLFQGYIFVRSDLSSYNWKPINNTKGVSRLLNKYGYPQFIGDEFVTCLQQRCNDNQIMIAESKVHIGGKVKLIEGPFTDFIGTIEQIHPSNRITMLFEYMGQIAKTNVKFTQVREL